jgi:hypothetical protein
MLPNTRAKLMRIIYNISLEVMTKFKFLFFDTFLNRQTNLESMFSALSVK